MYGLLSRLLFLLSPDLSHQLGLQALGFLEESEAIRDFLIDSAAPRPDSPLRMFGKPVAHRVGLAGGFDKNGDVPLALAALGFAFLELGTVTRLAQSPNPPPNLFRLPADRALINRLGFPNEGATRFAERLSKKRDALKLPIGISIGKSRLVDASQMDEVISDYRETFQTVADLADFFVINISSPNTVGLRSLQGAEMATRLLVALNESNARRVRPVPMLLKVAPDLDNDGLVALAALVCELGLHGMVATNTTVARRNLHTTPREVARIGAGGLSGPPLFARALEVVTLLRGVLAPHHTLIGVGGISSVDQAKQMRSAGADFLQLYTAMIYEGPSVARRIGMALEL